MLDVDWLILADAAQVVGNKLYLIGGGWDVLSVGSNFPIQQHCAVAVAFRVPWNDTNQPHRVEVEMLDEDGASLVKLGRQVEIGRPPGIPIGHDQRIQFAADLMLRFDHPGTYVIVARVADDERARTTFTVSQAQARTG